MAEQGVYTVTWNKKQKAFSLIVLFCQVLFHICWFFPPLKLRNRSSLCIVRNTSRRQESKSGNKIVKHKINSGAHSSTPRWKEISQRNICNLDLWTAVRRSHKSDSFPLKMPRPYSLLSLMVMEELGTSPRTATQSPSAIQSSEFCKSVKWLRSGFHQPGFPSASPHIAWRCQALLQWRNHLKLPPTYSRRNMWLWQTSGCYCFYYSMLERETAEPDGRPTAGSVFWGWLLLGKSGLTNTSGAQPSCGTQMAVPIAHWHRISALFLFNLLQM